MIANNHKEIAVVAYNNPDGATHTVDYYLDGVKTDKSSTELEGTINGFGSIKVTDGGWTYTDNYIGFQDLTVGAVYPSEGNNVDLAYKAEGNTVATVKGANDSSVPEKYVIYNGSLYHADKQTLSADTPSVDMEKVAPYASKHTNDIVASDDGFYKITGDSIVINGDFKAGTLGWSSRVKESEPALTVSLDETLSANSMADSTGGADALNSLGQEWAVSANNSYYIAFDVKTTNMDTKFNRIVDASKSYDFNGNRHESDLFTYGDDLEKDGQWHHMEKVIKPTNSTITLLSSWADNFGIANVELSPVEFVGEGTVTGYEEISANVANGETSANLPNTAVAIYEYQGVTRNVNVTVQSWDESTPYENSDAEPKVVKVKGTVEGQEKQPEATVNVYYSAELDDITSATNSTGGYNMLGNFPVSTKGDVTVEFDLTVTNMGPNGNSTEYGDLWVMINDSGKAENDPDHSYQFFGTGAQVAIGVSKEDKGGIRPVDGNKTGGRRTNPDQTINSEQKLEENMTVHFHVTANATSDTYTAYVIMPNAKQYKKEDFQFRGDGDKLDSIIAFTNNGRGEIKLTNVKITYAKLPVEEVKQPTAPKPALGWDSDSKQFTLNFTKATDEPGDAILIGDKSTAWGGNDTAVVKVGDKTNAVVTAYATTLNDVVKSVAAAKSIYELVVDDIVTNVGSYDKETVGADRIAAANKVISHGGFYYTGAGNNVADEVTKKIVNIEIVCSNMEDHKERVEKRKNEILGLKLPNWFEVINRKYEEWEDDRIVIETSKSSIEDCYSMLLEKVKENA